jgi:hypothetical protein
MSFIGAAIGIGTAIVGAEVSSSGAKSAAKTQASAANAATTEEQRQYDLTRGDLTPYRDQGTAALTELSSLLGLSAPQTPATIDPYNDKREQLKSQIDQQHQIALTGGANGYFADQKMQQLQKEYDALPPPPAAPAPGSQTPAMSPTQQLEQTPGFQFRLAEGQKGVERSAASRTGTLSGAATKAMGEYSQNFASNEYQAAIDRLMALSNLGETSAAQTGQFGAQKAGQVASNTIGAGNATAAGQVGSANAVGSAVSTAGNTLQQLALMRNSGYNSPNPSVTI